MLSKFRNLYPQGSILSELIDIDRGTYIVKVEIQINGITLATGLAGAEVVEKAEDMARNRALQTLVLEDGHLSLNLATKAPQEVSLAAAATASPITTAPQPNHRQDTKSVQNLSSSKVANFPTTVTPQEEIITATVKPQMNHSPTPDPLLSEPPVTAKNLPQPEPKPKPEAISSPPDVETAPLVPEYTEEILEPPLELTPPVEDYAPAAPSVETPPVTETPAEFDFNQIRHKIDLEMKRLSWTKEQGRDYLLSTYGKRSRLHLTDDELLEFWHYLEKLPN